jgi:phosphoglycerol transferase MdoB-like AlkP superfamily enzyme
MAFIALGLERLSFFDFTLSRALRALDQMTPPTIVCNLVLWAIPSAIAFALCSNWLWAILSSGVFIAIVISINALKVHHLSLPLVPFDLFAVNNVGILVDFISPGLWVLIAISLFLAVWALFMSWSRLSVPVQNRSRWIHIQPSRRLPAALITLIFGTPIVWGLSHPQSALYQPSKLLFQLVPSNVQLMSAAKRNGLAPSFALAWPKLHYPKPEGYSAIDAQIMLKSASSLPIYRSSSPTPARAIVAIMFEALFDPTLMDPSDGRFHGRVHFSRDPLPNFHWLQRNGKASLLISPAIGGLTANSEFEVLTGIPLLAMPSGSVPYQHYVRNPLDALPRVLQSQGYETLAVHNYTRGFWHRSVVYPLFGFEQFVALDNMPKLPRRYGWPIDDGVYDSIDAELNSANSKERLFAFGVTVATHRGYGAEVAPSDTKIQIIRDDSGAFPPGSSLRAALHNYINRLALADQSLGRFIERLKSLPNVSLIVFGDHQPKDPFSDAIMEYADPSHLFGESLSSAAAVEDARYRVVPVAAWNSSGNHPSLRPLQAMYCLGSSLLDHAEVETTPFWKLARHECDLNPLQVVPKSGVETSPARETMAKLGYYRIIDQKL